MRAIPRAIPVVLALILSSATAQAAANCALANILDYNSYATLTATDQSEAGMDMNAVGWADCRVAKLNRELQTNPQVRARMEVLRQQLREMRGLEGRFAAMRAGGGTLYAHAVPRTFPQLEEQIASLAALARSNQGAQVGSFYTQQIAAARTEHVQYIKTLRAYKPGSDNSSYDPKQWAKDLDRYEQLGKAIMLTLGNRNDAATALGYGILNTVTFPATDEPL